MEVTINAIRRRRMALTMEFWSKARLATACATTVMWRNASVCQFPSVEIGTGKSLFPSFKLAMNLCYFRSLSAWAALLGVRVLHTASSISNLKLSNKLLIWCEKLVGEFGFTMNQICSSASDAGFEVRLLCQKLLEGDRD